MFINWAAYLKKICVCNHCRGLLLSPIKHKCLLKVLCPVSRPITTLIWVLLKDNSRAPVARSGPEINSRACLCVLQGPRHNARFCFRIQQFNFLLIFCLETLKKGSGPTNHWAEPLLVVCRRFHSLSLPICRRCTEEETSVHTLCECEALASLRHTYLGSFFWTRKILRN